MVRAHRQRLGLTQEELAQAAGLGVRSIRKIEAGRTGSPRPVTVRLLADAFELTGAERDWFCQAAAGEPADQSAVRRAPAQLPPDVSAFTGRQEQLVRLDGLLSQTTDPPTAVVISAIAGTAGVGKTALAIHWAHRVAERFPDGQLYMNLRGYHPDQPTDPSEALTRLLAGLGVTGRDVPHDVDDRAARYRSELADRAMLIVLDNAGSVEQVRPLLPGSGTCAVVVTSRDSLAGLVAVHGAHRIDLGLLPPAEAFALVRRLIGPRADTDSDAMATLVEQCARLPLALRVAAELAISRPTTSLAELVAELGERQRRLDLLDRADDPHAAVRTVFSWSVQHLPPDAAATFRLLGLHPGPDIDAYAVAALAGTTLVDARRRLELLSRAHLVQPTGPGRYGMHDLLRAYAAELAHTHHPEQIRHAALSRLLDHYRYTASVAMDTGYPYERERRPRMPPGDNPTPDLSDPNQATAWLDAELPNLLAAAQHAADHSWPDHTVHLSGILRRHLRTRGRYHDAEALHHQALTTARTTGNRVGELDTLIGLAHVHRLQGRYERAAEHLGRALAIARATRHRVGELHALTGLARVHLQQGRPEQAAEHYQRAWEIAHTTGNRLGELDALIGLGDVQLLQGRYEQATEHYQRAWEIAHTTGNRAGELNALTGLGDVHRLQGRHEQAADHFQRAWEIAHATGNRIGALHALIGLGRLHLQQGRQEQAAEHLGRALEIADTTGNRNGRFEALQGLGRVHHATGHPGDALTHHHQALALATDLQQPADQARAHDGLAHAHRTLDHREHARQHWQQALDILTSLGTDHTEEANVTVTSIREHLAAPAGR
jgi:tetratricopeptide (TPR) repeat protein/transcriptional regulator with XRE-family HTH domain